MVRFAVMSDAGGQAPPNTDSTDREQGVLPMLHIVEDDASTLELLEDVARDAGWAVEGFTRISEFRSALQQRTPDLVILDDDLPDGRGGDLAREMRAHHRTRHVPLVVCTAAHPMRQAEITGWAPVIAKPFDLLGLEELLDGARARARRDHRQAAG